MRKDLLALSLLFFMGTKLPAQDSSGRSAPTPEAFGLGQRQLAVSLGSNGFQMEAAQRFNKNSQWNISLGYRFYRFDFQQQWRKKDITTSPDVQTLVAGASYDWFPFLHKKNKPQWMQALKAKAGAQYVAHPVYRFRSRLSTNTQWGRMSFSQAEVGTMHTTVTTNKLQPFVAAGYDRSVQTKKKYSIGADLGWIYQGKPSVTMKGDYLLETAASQSAQVERNLRSWQFFPYLQFRFQYQF